MQQHEQATQTDGQETPSREVQLANMRNALIERMQAVGLVPASDAPADAERVYTKQKLENGETAVIAFHLTQRSGYPFMKVAVINFCPPCSLDRAEFPDLLDYMYILDRNVAKIGTAVFKPNGNRVEIRYELPVFSDLPSPDQFASVIDELLNSAETTAYHVKTILNGEPEPTEPAERIWTTQKREEYAKGLLYPLWFTPEGNVRETTTAEYQEVLKDESLPRRVRLNVESRYSSSNKAPG